MLGLRAYAIGQILRFSGFCMCVDIHVCAVYVDMHADSFFIYVHAGMPTCLYISHPVSFSLFILFFPCLLYLPVFLKEKENKHGIRK